MSGAKEAPKHKLDYLIKEGIRGEVLSDLGPYYGIWGRESGTGNKEKLSTDRLSQWHAGLHTAFWQDRVDSAACKPQTRP